MLISIGDWLLIFFLLIRSTIEGECNVDNCYECVAGNPVVCDVCQPQYAYNFYGGCDYADGVGGKCLPDFTHIEGGGLETCVWFADLTTNKDEGEIFCSTNYGGRLLTAKNETYWWDYLRPWLTCHPNVDECDRNIWLGIQNDPPWRWNTGEDISFSDWYSPWGDPPDDSCASFYMNKFGADAWVGSFCSESRCVVCETDILEPSNCTTISNCVNCTESSTSCEECYPGFELQGEDCVPTILPTCEDCVGVGNEWICREDGIYGQTCVDCGGWYLNDSSCVECDICEHDGDHNEDCTSCSCPYPWNGTYCESCGAEGGQDCETYGLCNVENCFSCVEWETDLCDICVPNFIRDPFGGCFFDEEVDFGTVCELGEDWEFVGSTGINRCIKYEASHMDKYSATSYCEAQGDGVVLATVKSLEYSNALLSVLDSHPDRYDCECIWIGCNSIMDEDEWIWEDNNEPVTWNNFDYLDSDHCAVMDMWDGWWYDRHCEYDAYCVVCETVPVIDTHCFSLSNCLDCSNSSNVCDVCYPDFDNIDGICEPSNEYMPECQACEDGENWLCRLDWLPQLCLDCPGWILNGTECQKCDLCQNNQINDNDCTYCNCSYPWNPPYCESCSVPGQDCEIYGQCEIQYCEECVEWMPDTCLQCFEGYYTDFFGGCSKDEFGMSCMDGFTLIDDLEESGTANCVKGSSVDRDYNEAKIYCESNITSGSGNIMTIKSSSYSNLLYSYLENDPDLFSCWWMFWIGCNDIDVEQEWRWDDNGDIIDYHNFYWDGPDYYDETENCAYLDLDVRSWFTTNCDSQECAVCEHDVIYDPHCQTIPNCKNCSIDPEVCTMCYSPYFEEEDGECVPNMFPTCEDCVSGDDEDQWICRDDYYLTTCEECIGYWVVNDSSCLKCDLDCGTANHGEVNPNCTECNCNYPWSGTFCEICNVPEQDCEIWGVCDVSYCTKCIDWNPDVCEICSPNYYNDPFGGCILEDSIPEVDEACDTIPNCLNCETNPQNCTECYPKFDFFNGSCVPNTFPSCEECEVDGEWICRLDMFPQTCIDCPGWILNGTECQECDLCQNNQLNDDLCTFCNCSYPWTGALCETCLVQDVDCQYYGECFVDDCFGCVDFDPYVCKICDSNYFNDFYGGCVLGEGIDPHCLTIPNCKNCSVNSSVCNECYSEAFSVLDGECVPNTSPFCDDCVDGDQWICREDFDDYLQVCNTCPGWYINGSSCSKCDLCAHGGVNNDNCTLCLECIFPWSGVYCDDCSVDGKDCTLYGDCFVDNCEECVEWESDLCSICEPNYSYDYYGGCEFSSEVQGVCDLEWDVVIPDEGASKCILFDPTRRSYSESVSFCAEYGTNLVTVKSESFFYSLESLLEDLLDFESIKYSDCDEYAWIGCNDIEEEGDWIWVDDGEAVTWNMFDYGEGTNSWGDDEYENCGMYEIWWGHWFDIPCEDELCPVCEKLNLITEHCSTVANCLNCSSNPDECLECYPGFYVGEAEKNCLLNEPPDCNTDCVDEETGEWICRMDGCMSEVCSNCSGWFVNISSSSEDGNHTECSRCDLCYNDQSYNEDCTLCQCQYPYDGEFCEVCLAPPGKDCSNWGQCNVENCDLCVEFEVEICHQCSTSYYTNFFGGCDLITGLKTCPFGWEFVSGGGEERCLKYDDEMFFFHNALDHCSNSYEFSNMVMIKSNDFNNALWVALDSHPSRGFCGDTIWIGLSDFEQESDWRWIDGEELTWDNMTDYISYDDFRDCGVFRFSDQMFDDEFCGDSFCTVCSSPLFLQSHCESIPNCVNCSSGGSCTQCYPNFNLDSNGTCTPNTFPTCEECDDEGEWICRMDLWPDSCVGCPDWVKNETTGECWKCDLCIGNGVSYDSCSKCNCSNYWDGFLCDTCTLSCEYSFSPDDTCSYCECDRGFTGFNCSVCALEPTCMNGGFIGYELCPDCQKCVCPFPWGDVDCSECQLCQNGGTPSENCSLPCSCVNGFTGTYCSTCSQPDQELCETYGQCDVPYCSQCMEWDPTICEQCDSGFGSDYSGGCVGGLACPNEDWDLVATESVTKCLLFPEYPDYYDDSQCLCKYQSEKSDLVTIKSYEFSIALDSYLSGHDSRLGDCGNFAWIGLTDRVKEQDWRWVDGMNLTTYSNWGAGEGSYSESDNCVIFEIGYQQKWVDTSCSFGYCPVCEIILSDSGLCDTISNCLTCSPDMNNCTECLPGYERHPTGISCTLPTPSCDDCVDALTRQWICRMNVVEWSQVCDSCIGYYLDGEDQCLECNLCQNLGTPNHNCTSCTCEYPWAGIYCTVCSEEGKDCESISDCEVPGCLECIDWQPNSCHICEPGYYTNFDGGCTYEGLDVCPDSSWSIASGGGESKCLKLHSSDQDFEDAESYCPSNYDDSALMMIKSEEFQTSAISALSGDIESSYMYCWDGVWLGAQDEADEGVWRWVDDEIMTWHSFSQGEGMLGWDDDRNCATLDLSDQQFTGMWSDRYCDDYYCFVCEVELDPNSLCTTIPNCVSCPGEIECLSCYDNFDLFEGECVHKVVPTCEDCDQGDYWSCSTDIPSWREKCDECPGYIFDGETCKKCTWCLHEGIPDADCTSCSCNYPWEGSYCELCSVPDVDPSYCYNYGECFVEHCHKCFDFEPSRCEICNPGYYFSYNTECVWEGISTPDVCEDDGWEFVAGGGIMKCIGITAEYLMDYDDQKSICNDMFGGELLMLKNEGYSEAFYDMVDRSDYYYFPVFYLGLDNINDLSEWRWNDGDDLSLYENWDEGEGNSEGNENCAAVYIWEGHGRWNDNSCYENMPFSCQKDPAIPICATIPNCELCPDDPSICTKCYSTLYDLEDGQCILNSEPQCSDCVISGDDDDDDDRWVCPTEEKSWIDLCEDCIGYYFDEIEGVCKTCTLCQNDGIPNKDCSSCVCSYPWTGPTCLECQFPYVNCEDYGRCDVPNCESCVEFDSDQCLSCRIGYSEGYGEDNDEKCVFDGVSDICDDGWRLAHDSDSGTTKCIQYDLEPRDYDEMRFFCEVSEGGEMLMIKTESYFKVVRDVLEDLEIYKYSNDVLLGMDDRISPGNWIWNHDNTSVNWTNWKEGEGDGEEDCVVFELWEDEEKWMETSCDSGRLTVCQKDPNSQICLTISGCIKCQDTFNCTECYSNFDLSEGSCVFRDPTCEDCYTTDGGDDEDDDDWQCSLDPWSSLCDECPGFYLVDNGFNSYHCLQCEICMNGGNPDPSCTSCNCSYPWSGDYCEICSITNFNCEDYGKCEVENCLECKLGYKYMCDLCSFGYRYDDFGGCVIDEEKIEGVCEEGSTVVSGGGIQKCVHFSSFGMMNYGDVKDYCSYGDALMITIKNEEYQEKLLDFLRNDPVADSCGSDLWIGCDDIEEEMKWVWSDGEEVAWDNFGDWDGPNEWDEYENCGQIDLDDGMWRDSSCEYDDTCPVCEKELVPNSYCDTIPNCFICPVEASTTCTECYNDFELNEDNTECIPTAIPDPYQCIDWSSEEKNWICRSDYESYQQLCTDFPEYYLEELGLDDYVRCQRCEICQNLGIPDADCSNCTCIFPYEGDFCEECSIEDCESYGKCYVDYCTECVAFEPDKCQVCDPGYESDFIWGCQKIEEIIEVCPEGWKLIYDEESSQDEFCIREYSEVIESAEDARWFCEREGGRLVTLKDEKTWLKVKNHLDSSDILKNSDTCNSLSWLGIHLVDDVWENLDETSSEVSFNGWLFGGPLLATVDEKCAQYMSGFFDMFGWYSVECCDPISNACPVCEMNTILGSTDTCLTVENCLECPDGVNCTECYPDFELSESYECIFSIDPTCDDCIYTSEETGISEWRCRMDVWSHVCYDCDWTVEGDPGQCVSRCDVENCLYCVAGDTQKCHVCEPGYVIDYFGGCTFVGQICPEGWETISDGSNDLSKCVYIDSQERVFTDSIAFCEILGGDIIITKNEDYYNNVLSYVRTNIGSECDDEIFLGAYRTGDDFFWLDDGSSVLDSFNMFYDDECCWSTDECLIVNDLGGMPYWQEDSCESYQCPVCEKDVDITELCKEVPNCRICEEIEEIMDENKILCTSCYEGFTMNDDNICVPITQPSCDICVVDDEWKCREDYFAQACVDCNGWIINNVTECQKCDLCEHSGEHNEDCTSCTCHYPWNVGLYCQDCSEPLKDCETFGDCNLDHCSQCVDWNPNLCQICEPGYFLNYYGGCDFENLAYIVGDSCPDSSWEMVSWGGANKCVRLDDGMTRTFDQANSYCESNYERGSLLASKSAEFQDAFVTNFLLSTQVYLSCEGKFWLGLDDLEVETVWRWRSDGELLKWNGFDWYDSLYESYFNNEGEDCVFLDTRYDVDWSKTECTDSFCTICQTDSVVEEHCDTIPNCLKCSSNSSVCTDCYTHFSLIDGNCQMKDPYTCDLCVSEDGEDWTCRMDYLTDFCASCPGWIVYGTECQKCDICENGGVNNDNCTSCTCPYPWEGTYCEVCGEPGENCSVYGECWVNMCEECIEWETLKCLTCEEGFFDFNCVTECYGKLSNTSEVCGGGICEGPNQCVCVDGWSGEDCEEIAYCHGIMSNDTDQSCGSHGDCVSPNNCECHSTWHGEYCNVTECFGIPADEYDACDGDHGTCEGFNVCECQEPSMYFGPECNVTKCFDVMSNDTSEVCNGQGVCISFNECECLNNDHEFYGPYCNYTWDGSWWMQTVYDDDNGGCSVSSNVPYMIYMQRLRKDYCVPIYEEYSLWTDYDDTSFIRQWHQGLRCSSPMYLPIYEPWGNCSRSFWNGYFEMTKPTYDFSFLRLEGAKMSTKTTNGMDKPPSETFVVEMRYHEELDDLINCIISSDNYMMSYYHIHITETCLYSWNDEKFYYKYHVDPYNCSRIYYQLFSDSSCYNPISLEEEYIVGECKNGKRLMWIFEDNFCSPVLDESVSDCSVCTKDCFGIPRYSSDPLPCSGHGHCLGGDVCICDEGYYGENCDVTECDGFLSNETLSSVCYGHGICIDLDLCDCSEDYYSPEEFCRWFDCDGVRYDQPCVCNYHGTCDEPENCTCSLGYYGSYCQNWECFGIKLDNYSSVCSGKGVCEDYNDCDCAAAGNPNYYGDECQFWDCDGIRFDQPEVCNDQKGECVGPEICVCNETLGYWGQYCHLKEIFICDGIMSNFTDIVCMGHGECVGFNNCTCDEGYYPGGQNNTCSEFDCYGIHKNDSSVCNFENGTCDSYNNCSCIGGYYGLTCEMWDCYGIEYNASTVCTGQLGVCINPNDCNCEMAGYPNNFGVECELWTCDGILNNDSNVCIGHGSCVSFDNCSCDEGYYPEGICDEWDCFSIHKNDSSVCNFQNGTCVLYNNCSCFGGYYGLTCSEFDCFGVKHNESSVCTDQLGVCVRPNECNCEMAGYPNNFGEECELWTCDGILNNDTKNVCTGHGTCISHNNCTCEVGYYPGGENEVCDEWDCFSVHKFDSSVCNYQNGTCDSYNNCSCIGGYYGLMCEEWDCFGEKHNASTVCTGQLGVCIRPDNCNCEMAGYPNNFGVECELWTCDGMLNNDSNVCTMHGSCIAYENCTCDFGYYPPDSCDEWDCFGVHKNESSVCNFRNGTCVLYNNCSCFGGYYGIACEEWDCYGEEHNASTVCTDQLGVCVRPNDCNCEMAGYPKNFGEECELWTCSLILNNDSNVCARHGSCVSHDNCTCGEGYYPANSCEEWDCFGIHKFDSSVCNFENGTCDSYNNCSCIGGYYGLTCSEFDCFGVKPNDSSVCTGQLGVCIRPNDCNCEMAGYPNNFGEECELWTCSLILNNDSNVCAKHGACVSFDNCSCEEGYYPANSCDEWDCFDIHKFDSSVCNFENGTCDSYNNCSCIGGYYGLTCEEWDCFGEKHNASTVCTDQLGVCIQPDVCDCGMAGYPNNFGLECELWTCDGILNNDSDVCAIHGACVSFDNCTCEEGYFPPNACDEWNCYDIHKRDSSVCNFQNGSCDSYNNCSCIGGYYGLMCELWDCYGIKHNESSVCTDQLGVCVQPDVCDCGMAGYPNNFGDECQLWTCHGLVIDNHVFEPFLCHGHGNCLEYDDCECTDEEGYVGQFCDIPVCYGLNASDEDVCSRHGECMSKDCCSCTPEYKGEQCEITITSCFEIDGEDPDVCGGHGSCVDKDYCECDPGYYKDQLNESCTIWKCFGEFNGEDDNNHLGCNGHGNCTSPNLCECLDGYLGDDCGMTGCGGLNTTDPDVCSGIGQCVYPEECICNPSDSEGQDDSFSYFGSNCEVVSVMKVGKSLVRATKNMLLLLVELKEEYIEEFGVTLNEQFLCSKFIGVVGSNTSSTGLLFSKYCIFSNILEFTPILGSSKFLKITLDHLSEDQKSDAFSDITNEGELKLTIGRSSESHIVQVYPPEEFFEENPTFTMRTYSESEDFLDQQENRDDPDYSYPEPFPEMKICKSKLLIGDECIEQYECVESIHEPIESRQSDLADGYHYYSVGYVPNPSGEGFFFAKFYYKDLDSCESGIETEEFVIFSSTSCYGSDYGDSFFLYDGCSNDIGKIFFESAALTYFLITSTPVFASLFLILFCLYCAFSNFTMLCCWKCGLKFLKIREKVASKKSVSKKLIDEGVDELVEQNDFEEEEGGEVIEMQDWNGMKIEEEYEPDESYNEMKEEEEEEKEEIEEGEGEGEEEEEEEKKSKGVYCCGSSIKGTLCCCRSIMLGTLKSFLMVLVILLKEGTTIWFSSSEFLDNSDIDVQNKDFVFILGIIEFMTTLIWISIGLYLFCLSILIVTYVGRFHTDPFMFCIAYGALKEIVYYRIFKAFAMLWFICVNVFCYIIKFEYSGDLEKDRMINSSDFWLTIILPISLLFYSLVDVLNYNGVSSHRYLSRLRKLGCKRMLKEFPRVSIGFLDLFNDSDSILEDLFQLLYLFNSNIFEEVKKEEKEKEVKEEDEKEEDEDRKDEIEPEDPKEEELKFYADFRDFEGNDEILPEQSISNEFVEPEGEEGEENDTSRQEVDEEEKNMEEEEDEGEEEEEDKEEKKRMETFLESFYKYFDFASHEEKTSSSSSSSSSEVTGEDLEDDAKTEEHAEHADDILAQEEDVVLVQEEEVVLGEVTGEEEVLGEVTGEEEVVLGEEEVVPGEEEPQLQTQQDKVEKRGIVKGILEFLVALAVKCFKKKEISALDRIKESDECGHMSWGLIENLTIDEIMYLQEFFSQYEYSKETYETIFFHHRVFSWKWITNFCFYPFRCMCGVVYGIVKLRFFKSGGDEEEDLTEYEGDEEDEYEELKRS